MIYALRHWKPYLIGKEFVLRMDHIPNVSIADSKTKLYDTLSDKIMQFQPFRMEYLRGDRMFVDALSRPPPSTVNAISLKDIEHAQPLDPYLQSLRKAKRSPSPLIFRNNAFFHLDGRLYVPRAKREEVLIACHDQAGHFGLQHTCLLYTSPSPRD